jgi:hypothetical protein
MALPWYIFSVALDNGRGDSPLEIPSGERCFESCRAIMDRGGHLCVLGADQCEYGFTRHYGQACEHAVCDNQCVISLSSFPGRRVLTGGQVVLTTVWCELMADPKLFVSRPVPSRDHKMLGIAALFVGGFCSRAILQAIGSPASLGIGAGLRVVIALSWFFVPAKRTTATKRP